MQGRSTRVTAPAQVPQRGAGCADDRRRPPALLGSRRATTTRGCATSRRSRSATATTGAIRRRYLPPDYRADAAPFARRADGLRRGRMGSAPIRSARCATSRRCAASTACRPSRSRRPGSTATTRRSVLEQQAAFAFVRSVRHKPRANRSPADAAPGGMTDARVARRLRASSRRNGLRFDLQTPWWHLARGGAAGRRFPGHARSSSTTPGLPADRSAEGIAGWKRAMATLAACPNVAVKISGLGQPGAAVDRRGQPRHRAHGDRTLRRRALHVREQLPGRQPVRELRARSSAASARSSRDFSAAEQRALFRDNAIRIYAMDHERMTPSAHRLRRRRPDGPADGQAPGLARLRGRAYDIAAAQVERGARGRRAGRAHRRPTRRAAPTSCCSTCRRPRRSRQAVFGADGVASAIAAAAARRRLLDRQGRQGPRVRRAAARARPAAAGSTRRSPAARRRRAAAR